MARTLRNDQTEGFEPDEGFHTDCFDRLFFNLDHIGHYVRESLPWTPRPR
jgi:hypothetical protein